MNRIIMRFAIGSMFFVGAVLMAQEPKKENSGFNQAATNLLVQQAKNGTLTPEKLKKLIKKKADINTRYRISIGTEANLFLQSVLYPQYSAIESRPDGFGLSDEYANRLKILKTLVEAGADTNVTDGSGRNALVLAICYTTNGEFRDYIVKYLHTEAHVAIDKADAKGNTPLMCAVAQTANITQSENGKVPYLVSYLVNANANVNAANAEGVTILMCAACLNTLETVKFLILNGAKIDAKDKQGRTAADYSRDRQYKKILNYLEEKMLDDL